MMESTVQITPRGTDIERQRPDVERPPVDPAVPQLVVRPLIDVLENGDGIRVVADLPGVAAADTDIRVEMPLLRVSATRTLANGTRVAYHTTLRLPETIDPESLSAELRHGVLEIGMSKHAQARARRIEVRTL